MQRVNGSINEVERHRFWVQRHNLPLVIRLKREVLAKNWWKDSLEQNKKLPWGCAEIERKSDVAFWTPLNLVLKLNLQLSEIPVDNNQNWFKIFSYWLLYVKFQSSWRFQNSQKFQWFQRFTSFNIKITSKTRNKPTWFISVFDETHRGVNSKNYQKR